MNLYKYFFISKGIKKLKNRFGRQFVTDSSLLESFCTDESGEKGEMPLGVVFPESTKEVSLAAKICYHYKVPYTVRGKGTGKTGGALLSKPGVIICLERMTRIEIDDENMLAVVEAGVITADLYRAAAEKGLFYPVDPASIEMSSIGGNIAENAGGPRAFKYGVTKDFILGLEVVLPNGKIIEMGGKTRKNVTGYNLKDLIIGSEGTLATVTKANIKLLPLPKERFLLWSVYDDFKVAISSIHQVYQSGFSPSIIEFIENRALLAVEKLTSEKIPCSEYAAHLLVEVDGFDNETINREAKILSEILLKNGAKDVFVFPFENKQDEVWEMRRKISEAMKFISFNKASEDIVVPPSNLLGFLSKMKRIEERYGVEIICYGHLGDGNVHVNILNVKDESGEVWNGFKNQVLRMIFEIVKHYKGTLSGEHGIGITKRPYLKMFLDKNTISIHKKIKKIFDPQNLLNPRKIWS